MKKILYIFKRDPDDTFTQIIDAHRKSENITIVDIRNDKDYEKIIGLIDVSDRIICI